MPKNNSVTRREARRAEAIERNARTEPRLLKPCLCGHVHRAGWEGCQR